MFILTLMICGLLAWGAVAEFRAHKNASSFDRHADQAIDLTGGRS